MFSQLIGTIDSPKLLYSYFNFQKYQYSGSYG